MAKKAASAAFFVFGHDRPQFYRKNVKKAAFDKNKLQNAKKRRKR